MISIIIPTYNSAKTIKRCLDSIIAQTYKDYEVLVMDGCSKDGTLDIVRTYKDEHIHLYSEPDKGIYDAMNKGIKRAKGDWLYFLGGDDYLFAPDVLEKVAKDFNLEYKIVYGEVDAQQLPAEYRGEWNLDLLEYNRCHQAIFYHRSVFKEYGVYDLSYRLYADYIYNLNCFWRYRLPTKHIGVTIAHYSPGGASTMGDDFNFKKDIAKILLKLGEHNNCSITRRKEFAYNVIRNSKSRRDVFEMRIYIYYLRLIAKFLKIRAFSL